MIDPHQKYFPSSTYGWNIQKRADLRETIPHQFEPYKNIFLCAGETLDDGHYDGTLFRFPLRDVPSSLSDNVYSSDSVLRLFECFQADADRLLIFLKHLESVELYIRGPRDDNPRLLYSVKIADECLYNVRSRRQDFLYDSGAEIGKLPMKSVISSFPIHIDTIQYHEDGYEMARQRHSWLVTNYFGGSMQISAVMRKLHQDPDISYLPWVGIAMEMSENGSQTDQDAQEANGHIFCFLPLPPEKKSMTGLPIHVNGFFALEQNRKYLKWPSADQSAHHVTDKKLMWNRSLLTEVVPKAYVQLILRAIELSEERGNSQEMVEAIYKALPDMDQVDRKWEIVLAPFYTELLQHRVFFTPANGGNWIKVNDAIFNTLGDKDEAKNIVLKSMLGANRNVVSVPPHVELAVKRCCFHVKPKTITPELVGLSFQESQYNSTYDVEDKIYLLRYILKNERYEDLCGLELLPLSNGCFTEFISKRQASGRSVYIASTEHPQSLLPGMEERFLNPDIDEDIRKMLGKLARKGKYRIICYFYGEL